jgi:hypothetical protein
LFEALIKAASIFSRRSFEAAWLTAEALERNLQNSMITFKLHDRDRKCIHRVWSFLADEGHRLIIELRSLNYEMNTVIDALSSAGESLKDEVKDLRDLVAEAERALWFSRTAASWSMKSTQPYWSAAYPRYLGCS